MLEFLYGDRVSTDPDEESEEIDIGGDVNNINLRSIYESIIGTPTASSKPKFIFSGNVFVGSANISTPSIVTGDWVAGMVPIKIVVQGTVAGKGGDVTGLNQNGGNGGVALSMSHDVTIENVTGLLGGGGGSGVNVNHGGFTSSGGGGGGVIRGIGLSSAYHGTNTTGGAGQVRQEFVSGDIVEIVGGDGGDLGENGKKASVDFTPTAQNGGIAGAAINKNGHTLVIENGSGNIKGAITA